MPRKKNKAKIYIFFGIIVLIAIFFVFNFFAHAKVYITPKVELFSFNAESFTASKNAKSNLPFEVMIVEGSEEKKVTFSENKKVSTKAVGTVVVYNEYSTTAQKLLINTRLSDDKGLIYMTDKAISIPGYTKSGSKIVPGSTVVTVTAQNVGDKYNSEPKDFKVLGFKGTPKYDKIYARAKTSFSGGVTGDFYLPNNTEKETINKELDTKLRTSLQEKVLAEIPEGYITYLDSMQFNMSIDEKSLLSPTKEANIAVNGKMATIIFKEEDFKREVIKRAYPSATEIDFKEISIPLLKDLKFAFSNPNYIITKEAESISFNLSGDKSLEWHPVARDLINKLSGVSKKEIDAIFKQDSGVLRARVVFIPPWQMKMPNDVKKIKIIEETTKS